MEKQPSEKEIARHVPNPTLKALVGKLEGSGTTLAGVLHKVCEDVEAVARKRCQTKERVAKSRSYNKSNALQPQRRGEKRREEKIKEQLVERKFEEIYSLYPKRIKRKESFKYFKGSVLNEGDFAQIQIALANYLECKEVKEGYVQNASTWFNNWKDWIVDPNEDTNALKHKTKSVDKQVERMLNATTPTNV